MTFSPTSERSKYFLGIVLVLLANVLTVLSNYFVKANKTAAADIILFKGVFQIPVFAAIVLLAQWKTKKQQQKKEEEEPPKTVASDNEAVDGSGGESKQKVEPKQMTFFPRKTSEKFGCLAYAFSGGVRYASIYSAVLFVPMADLIVVLATTPIFSYFFQRLFLKTKITVLKVTFCLVVVVGVVLVVKPPMLFPQQQAADDQVATAANQMNATTTADNSTLLPLLTTVNTTQSELNDGSEEESVSGGGGSKFSMDYWIGFGFGLSFAVSSALCNNIPCYFNKVAVNVFMFWAGWGSIGVAFLLPTLVGLEMNTLYNAAAMTWEQWLSVTGLAAIALFVNLLLIVAALWSSPTVMSMVRRTEILLVLFIDMAYYSIFPDAISGVGYGLVLFSVCGIVVANDIQKWINDKIAAFTNNKDGGSQSKNSTNL